MCLWGAHSNVSRDHSLQASFSFNENQPKSVKDIRGRLFGAMSLWCVEPENLKQF